MHTGFDVPNSTKLSTVFIRAVEVVQFDQIPAQKGSTESAVIRKRHWVQMWCVWTLELKSRTYVTIGRNPVTISWRDISGIGVELCDKAPDSLILRSPTFPFWRSRHVVVFIRIENIKITFSLQFHISFSTVLIFNFDKNCSHSGLLQVFFWSGGTIIIVSTGILNHS